MELLQIENSADLKEAHFLKHPFYPQNDSAKL
jgi:hypothetical protein